jgi:hypothetical protein
MSASGQKHYSFEVQQSSGCLLKAEISCPLYTIDCLGQKRCQIKQRLTTRIVQQVQMGQLSTIP